MLQEALHQGVAEGRLRTSRRQKRRDPAARMNGEDMGDRLLKFADGDGVRCSTKMVWRCEVGWYTTMVMMVRLRSNRFEMVRREGNLWTLETLEFNSPPPHGQEASL